MPENFLDLVVSGLINLRDNDRSNIIYSLVKGVATFRDDHIISLWLV